MRELRAALVLAASLTATMAAGQTDHPLGPDSERQPGVAAGVVSKHAWTSRIFPGTQRDYWVYVPAQYRADQPAALMVFQDGARFVAEDGRWRLPIVLDNLIGRGEMPVTIGVFVDPGVLPALSADQQARYDRSFEYDGLGDRYARFLLEELLPEIQKEHAISADPNLRGLGGSSSGGIAAFTAAWERPDAFRRVLSFIGSYTGLRGGDLYPTLVRKTEPKPIRVFLQDGSADLDIYSGNWWLGNQTLASALEYAGYDVRFVRGDRGHDGIHGSAILPDALRWLWRDWKTPLAPSAGRAGAERHYATEILDPAAPFWEKVAQGQGTIAGLAVGAEGDVSFSDAQGIRRLKPDGGPAILVKATPGAGALGIGPDGRLFVAVAKRGLLAYDSAGRESAVSPGLEIGDLVVGARAIWASDPRQKRIWRLDGQRRHAAAEGVDSGGSLMLSPDQALLTTASADGQSVWSYQVDAEGTLRHGQPFYRLAAPDGESAAPQGMAVDSEGFLYVATALGIQVFDQPGRLTAILSGPPGARVTRIAFGGAQMDTLYAAAGETLFRRKLRRKGVHSWQPVKPPVPRL